MAVRLRKNPRILDIGAGPGANSLALARSSAEKVTAVDRHQPFLDELERRAREAGLAERITTLNASMSRLPFEEGSFDLIWSEGAICLIGFRQGLTYWRRFLSPNGYIAVTEPCWLTSPVEIGLNIQQ
jgi:ubiquinone/menaquinone biosynthesis C-methylase UbiE